MTTTPGLNHGIAMQGGYLYASSDSTVYRWPYSGGRQALGTPQTVVSGLPTGGHSTRTLLFDGDGRLYVAIGSGSNVDPNSSRAKIIRFAAGVLATGARVWKSPSSLTASYGTQAPRPRSDGPCSSSRPHDSRADVGR